jgi:hypothetical protein
MKEEPDFEQAVAKKINYRFIDAACCLTCAYANCYEMDLIECKAHTYYNPEMGEMASWFGDPLGICDSYIKKETAS